MVVLLQKVSSHYTCLKVIGRNKLTLIAVDLRVKLMHCAVFDGRSSSAHKHREVSTLSTLSTERKEDEGSVCDCHTFDSGAKWSTTESGSDIHTDNGGGNGATVDVIRQDLA